ncbi:hypothetical protein [Lysinibacillus xylanilyticus]|uniref:hypothetical protein n=1 Tax=Lysinibacillus xylanilyticus TaxID=582475 RepID=UPI003818D357
MLDCSSVVSRALSVASVVLSVVSMILSVAWLFFRRSNDFIRRLVVLPSAQ